MDADDKKRLRTNYLALNDAIKPQIQQLTTSLWQRCVISENMKENVLEKPTTDSERSMALLDLLPKRGKAAYDAFYTSCRSLELYDAADILRSEDAPHMPEVPPPPLPRPHGVAGSGVVSSYESSEEEGLPDVWPGDEKRDMFKLDVKTIPTMNDEKKKKRYTQKYKDAVSTKGRNMLTELKRMADKISNGPDDPDCFILFILSHGHNEVVYGTDGTTNEKDKTPQNCLKVKDITDIFTRVTTLRGKPKLFFIQACQGTKEDDGKPVGKVDGPCDSNQRVTEGEEEPEGDNIAGGKQENGDQDLDNTLNYLMDETSDSQGEKVASQADIFIAMATPPEFVSWRRPDFGTWFIQAIIEVFSRYAYKYDIQKLMTRVNNLIGRAETKKGCKQIMHKQDTFQRHFYFFPDLSANSIN